MRLFFRLALALLVSAAALGTAYAQGDAVYIVTYVEVMPNEVADGATLLKRYRDASRKEDGNLRFDALVEIARPNRFVIIETWSSKAALDAHDRSAATAQFRDKIKAIADAPDDQRINNALYNGRGPNRGRAGAVYVVTHVDVIPPGKDACMAALKAMSVDTPKDPGNISYEVMQQANRSNHFSVVEEWTDMKAADGHAMAAHTRAFREKLTPVAGAIYDERFYRALN
jgi:quinol monooxygenase YgiN